MSPVDAPKTGAAVSPAGRLDTLLGKYTMYRLILLVLSALAAYSLLLNALGWLTFGIPQMLVHLALCVGRAVDGAGCSDDDDHADCRQCSVTRITHEKPPRLNTRAG